MISAEPRLVDTGRGYTIAYKGRHLYSTQSPIGAALRRVDALSVAPHTLFFLPSLCLGYGIERLLEKLPPYCHILCVEADERLFRLALDNAPSLPKSELLTIIRTDNPAKAVAALHAVGTWKFRRLVAVHLNGGYQLYRREYLKIQEALEEEIRLFWQNKLTLMAMSRLWLKNLFANLGLLAQSEDISVLETGRPVLVSGAGPSLEKSLDRIDRIRERIVIMAVDTALPVLLAAGIIPDWVFTLEAQIYNLDDFLPCHDPGLKILCDLTSNPQTLRLFPRLHFFCSRFHPLRLFDRLEASGLLPTVLAPRGSVGVAAVEAALSLTDGPVLLAGLDFSYPHGQTHSRGAPVHLAMQRTCTRLQPFGMRMLEALDERPRLLLSGKAQKPVVTDLVLRSYALQLASIVGGSPRVFDLSREGLPTGARPLEDFKQLDRICSPPAKHRTHPARPPQRTSKSGRDSKAATGRVLAFCRREMELLDAACGKIHTFLAQDSSEKPEVLAEMLTETEYLMLSVPEVDPQRLFSPSNLKAAASAARFFISRLQRTCDRLGPLS
jgi:hypothetical protein